MANSSNTQNTSTSTTKQIAFALTHAGSLMIGANCFINAYVYMSGVPPYLSIPAGLAGFFLNYILYMIDYKIVYDLIEDCKKNGLKTLFKHEFLISCMSGLLMALFTYSSWNTMLVEYGLGAIIPPYFPALFSFSYFIGTAVLLGSEMIGIKDENSATQPDNWKTTLSKSFKALQEKITQKKPLQFLKLLIAYGIALIFIGSTVVKTYLPDAISFFTPYGLLTSRAALIFLLPSICLSELTFNIKAMGKICGVEYQGTETPFTFTPAALIIGMIILANGLGNAFIGLGKSGFVSKALEYTVLLAGGITSCIVMFNANKTNGKLSFSVFGEKLNEVNNSQTITACTWGLATLLLLLHSTAMPIAAISAVSMSGCVFFLCRLVTPPTLPGSSEIKPAYDSNEFAPQLLQASQEMKTSALELDAASKHSP